MRRFNYPTLAKPSSDREQTWADMVMADMQAQNAWFFRWQCWLAVAWGGSWFYEVPDFIAEGI